MTPLRVVVGVAAGVVLAASFAGAVRLGSADANPGRAPELEAAHAHPAPPAPALGPPSPALDPVLAARRQKIAAGVLARAASMRAQEREATCGPCAGAAPLGAAHSAAAAEARAKPEVPAPAARPDAGGRIESIEIDWNAGSAPQAQAQ